MMKYIQINSILKPWRWVYRLGRGFSCKSFSRRGSRIRERPPSRSASGSRPSRSPGLRSLWVSLAPRRSSDTTARGGCPAGWRDTPRSAALRPQTDHPASPGSRRHRRSGEETGNTQLSKRLWDFPSTLFFQRRFKFTTSIYYKKNFQFFYKLDFFFTWIWSFHS